MNGKIYKMKKRNAKFCFWKRKQMDESKKQAPAKQIREID
jgi:hypothetical protein